jgi:two-component system response regulator MprA/two-component system response regulator PrrA
VAQVLVVEDDPTIRTALVRGLTERGHAVASAPTGLAGLEHAVGHRPDVVVLDLGLPDVDGAAILRMLRGVSRVPVVVATARDDEAEIVAVLDAGADDYVVKPFALEEVAARLHALLRRRPAGEDEIVEAGDLRLDPRTHSAQRGDRDLDLTRREFELLRFFLHHADEVIDRRRLHEEVWGYTFDPGTNVADVFVGYVRRKLEEAGEPRILHTVRGIGWALRP